MTRQSTAVPATGQAVRSLHILQFTGPVTEAQKAAVTRLGAELGDYLPENAFLVRMDGKQREKVAALSFVNGVAPYKASYKVDGALHGAKGSVAVQVTSFAPGGGGRTYQTTVDAAKLAQMAESSDLIYLEPAPAYVTHNEKAAGIMRVSPVWKSGYDGKGQVVAVTDTGLDTGKNDASMHPDFQGQIKRLIALGKPGDASDTLAHGTHVAGSVLGSGRASGGAQKGMAPGAQLVFQAVEDKDGSLGGIPEDLTQLFQQAYDAGARIHTNSWGIPVTSGGDIYNAQSSQVDRFMWEHRDYTILFAAGNDGDHDRNGQTNYGTVSAPSTAKNAITVGASQNDRPERKMATDVTDMASFSSRGPTKDNRVKPDIVAPGTWILSARSSVAEEKHFWAIDETNSRYGYMGGTSMATPLTAGTVAVLRQFYVESLKVTPAASLLKATLINSAASMKSGLTWKDTGWGRVDLNEAVGGTPFRFVNEEKALATGQSQSYSYTVEAGAPLKATLVWTDYPANPSAEKTLVNDLDLLVTGPDGKKVAGNHMLGATPDRINNVENVVVAAPTSGTYTVTVSGYNVPQGPQPFALVLSGNVSDGTAPAPKPEEPKPNPKRPTASVTSPANGATLTGKVSLRASASDAKGITKVLYYVDGVYVGRATTAPYTLHWDSTTVADGPHEIVANAYNTGGYVGISAPVRVAVQNKAQKLEAFQFTGQTAVYSTVRKFHLTMEAGGQVIADLGLLGSARASLTALDPTGREIASGEKGLRFTAGQAGTYTINLTSSGGWADYALMVNYPPASPVELHRGSLTTSDRTDIYEVKTSKQGALNALVTAQSKGADIDIYLLDAQGRYLTTATSPNLNPESISAHLDAGTYYLYVVTDSGGTPYELKIVHPE